MKFPPAFPTSGVPIAPDLPEMNFDIENKTIDIDKQQTLFKPSKVANNCDMGYFFEQLSSLLFKGRICNHLYIKRKGNKEGEFHPDVINDEKNMLIESKAIVVSSGQLILSDSQIEKYEAFQFYDETNVKIYFAVFFHNIRKVQSFKGNKRAMFKLLGRDTHAGVILPFSIIHKLWKAEYYNQLATRYKYWGQTLVGQKGLKKFAFDPISAVSEIGLLQRNFIYRKGMIPKGMMVNRQEIEPFPIVYIDDKNHAEWLERFKSKLDGSLGYERMAF